MTTKKRQSRHTWSTSFSALMVPSENEWKFGISVKPAAGGAARAIDVCRARFPTTSLQLVRRRWSRAFLWTIHLEGGLGMSEERYFLSRNEMLAVASHVIGRWTKSMFSSAAACCACLLGYGSRHTKTVGAHFGTLGICSQSPLPNIRVIFVWLCL
jgi:hypothetical protein